MGIHFRGGEYHQYVRLGKRTIKHGEAAAIWSLDGTHREVVGPRLVRMFCSSIRFLTRVSATKDEYLYVRYVDGREEHKAGPASIFVNPVHHTEVLVKQNIKLQTAGDYLVVYAEGGAPAILSSDDDNAGTFELKPILSKKVDSGTSSMQSAAGGGDECNKSSLTRTILKGPLSFSPAVNDFVHEFKFSPLPPMKVLNECQSFGGLVVPVNVGNDGGESGTVTLNVSVVVSSVSALIDRAPNLLDVVTKSLRIDVSHAMRQVAAWPAVHPTLLDMCSDLTSFPCLQATVAACGCKCTSVSATSVEPCAELAKAIATVVKNKQTREAERAQQIEKAGAAARDFEAEKQLKERETAWKKATMLAEQEVQTSTAQFEAKMLNEKEGRTRDHSAKKNAEVISFLKEVKELGVDIDKLLASSLSAGRTADKAGAGVEAKFAAVGKLISTAPAFRDVWAALEGGGD